jgi:hypothetical protein
MAVTMQIDEAVAPRSAAASAVKGSPETNVRAVPVYTSRIQKAAGALPETKLVLAFWEPSKSVNESLQGFEQTNLLGKLSPTRAHDLLFRTFKQRYTEDRDTLNALVVLARANLSARTFDPILYFLTARADRLLHDAVTDLLTQRIRSFRREITVDETVDWLSVQMDAGRMERAWSETTARRVARSLLAALRDFGLLAGVHKKTVSPVFLPVEAFAFIAFLLARTTRSGSALLDHPDWALFFLPETAVDRFFAEAASGRLLSYQAAGSTARIDFPAGTAEDYARLIT